jgi:hypothetical protein
VTTQEKAEKGLIARIEVILRKGNLWGDELRNPTIIAIEYSLSGILEMQMKY